MIDKDTLACGIADRVELSMKQKGLSRKDLQDILPVRGLSDWKHRGSAPSIWIVARLAERLGVSLDYLVWGKEAVSVKGLSDKEKEARFVPCPLEVHPVETTENIMLHRLRNTCISLGIAYTERGISLHSLRSFFNTYLRSKGISDAKIRGVMGHKDGTMTDWYTNWDISMFNDVLAEQKKLIELIVS